MKPATKLFGLTAACAACCTLPAAGAWLAGVGLGSAVDWRLGLALLAASGAGGVVLLLRRRSFEASACSAAQGACGCAGTTLAKRSADRPMSEPAIVGTEPAPIACTLTPGNFQDRAKWIRELARRSLRSAERGPLALHLTYASEAALQVRELVRKEQACCSFLNFDLREDARGVHLTITAPEDARDAAEMLFAHFAPEEATASSRQKEFT